jgi:hypothetical protein
MSSPERATEDGAGALDASAQRLAREIIEKVESGQPGALAPEALQALAAAICRVYGASAEADVAFPILSGRNAVSSTDVMTVCSALLKAADLQVFELGMWSSWTGR